MELVLKAITPIFLVLCFTDQKKNGTISGFLPKMLNALDEIRAKLGHKPNLLERLTEVINRRLKYLVNETLMLATAALDPEALYRTKFAQKPSSRFAITLVLKKIAGSPSKAAV
ncbi:uncharacterized protein LOC133896899 [Phragmites australis]|uniref:uncharacterized protein LOC133896899 n=1 Tax=Phragmites australis TaxID=29695 RepID=UPI002D7740ED|nr:uncharacterized protein LOC133896899 [Phragmites australis]